MAHIVLLSLLGILAYTFNDAMSSFDESISVLSNQQLPDRYLNGLQNYRIIVGSYCFLLVIVFLTFTGPMPLTTYTITSWNLMVSRLLFSYFGNLHSNKLLIAISQILRFPALVGCTITVVIWWLVLVPIIHHFTEGTKRAAFWKFNTGPVLIHVHLLNLPIVVYEFLWSQHKLYMIDLWCGLFVAIAYLLFYLFVLDPAGYHFYIILSPRTVFCIVPYIVILSLYLGLYMFWNYILLEY